MKEIEIYNLMSDASLLDELSLWVRNRTIDQKFRYTWKGAKLYYNEINDHPIYTNHDVDYKEIISNLDLWKNTSVISLGCGNSLTEQWLFNNYIPKWTHYCWVDSSHDMLSLSIKNLENENIPTKLICADFWSNNFRLELNHLTSEYEKRVFIFLSNTFWNINHTNITDILSNLLKTWEKIWLDVRVRKWLSIKDDLEISEIVSSNSKRKETIQSHMKILKEIWINLEDGKRSVHTTKETYINALKFQYHFTLNTKKEVNIKWDKIILLPWEVLKLYKVYSYDPDSLEKFFNEHGFKLIDKQIKWYRGQFIFEKE